MLFIRVNTNLNVIGFVLLIHMQIDLYIFLYSCVCTRYTGLNGLSRCCRFIQFSFPCPARGKLVSTARDLIRSYGSIRFFRILLLREWPSRTFGLANSALRSIESLACFYFSYFLRFATILRLDRFDHWAAAILFLGSFFRPPRICHISCRFSDLWTECSLFHLNDRISYFFRVLASPSCSGRMGGNFLTDGLFSSRYTVQHRESTNDTVVLTDSNLRFSFFRFSHMAPSEFSTTKNHRDWHFFV